MSKIEGQLGYYGLGDWWTDSLSEDERQKILAGFAPMGLDSSSLIKGKVASTKQSAVFFLFTLAEWFYQKENRPIAFKIYQKGLELIDPDKNPQDTHSFFESMITMYYKNRDEPAGLDKAIEICQLHINASQRLAAAFKTQGVDPLPNHKGYEQLAIIYDKSKQYQKVIDLCNEAHNVGWYGTWDARVASAEKKLNK